MSTIDVLLQSIGIKSFTLGIISWETILRVRNVETSITSTLHSSKDSASSGGFPQPNIEEDFEGSACIFDLFSHGVTAIWFLDTFILLCKTNLGQSATSNEQSSGICGSPILETMFNAVFRQLRWIRRCKYNITLQFGVNDLTNL